MRIRSSNGVRSAQGLVAGVCLLVLSAGCVSPIVHTAPATARRPIVVSPDKSTVVFVRAGILGPMKCVVVDANARYLGEFTWRSYTVRQVDPGRHVFYAWTNLFDTPKAPNLIEAEMEGGRIYYVFLRGWGSGAYSGVDIEQLSPRREEWIHLEEWLRRSTFMEVDEAAGTASLEPAAVRDALTRARDAFDGYEPRKKEHHLLAASDGQTTTPVIPASND